MNLPRKWSRTVILTCSYLSSLAMPSVRADTFTILDANDSGGSVGVVSTDPARLVITSQGAFGFDSILLSPSPSAVFVSDDCPLGEIVACDHLNIGEYPINPDPLLDFESDIFQAGLEGNQYQMHFGIQLAEPCEFEGACLVRENGQVYTLDTVTWSDGTVDTINFQSTPEPTSLLLLGTIGLLVVLKRRRLLWITHRDTARGALARS